MLDTGARTGIIEVLYLKQLPGPTQKKQCDVMLVVYGGCKRASEGFFAVIAKNKTSHACLQMPQLDGTACPQLNLMHTVNRLHTKASSTKELSV